MSRRHVALLIESSNAYSRGLLEGIIAYTKQHDRWSVSLPEQGRGAAPPTWLTRWKGDGIIARIETPEIAQAVRKARVPTIDLSAGRHLPEVPCIETDDEAIAQAAFDHLAERGFRSFGFLGEPEFAWSNNRRDSFSKLVKDAGGDLSIFDSKPSHEPRYSWRREWKRLVRWIESLPKPAGVMACYDIAAVRLLDACREIGIAVPESVAVIGVDDDPLLCDLSRPSLSSVVPDASRTGRMAAEQLDAMIAGERTGPLLKLVKPLGITTRQSTEVLAIEDPLIARSVRIIRERAFDGISVGDVLREIPLSRRLFESRFVAELGVTPRRMLTRLQMERASLLLRTTELTIAAVASAVGYSHVESFSVAFRRESGVPPGEYRRATATGNQNGGQRGASGI
ncbi:XylR family transcriptional regulator [Stratiformator vulcanicus]|uniref:XylR family transcriptional regulator n=1 Tax=Stratiformator vulcanicus TaxID=2527980 RepID=UPI0011AB0356|nr:DNA-binding transcriptional regulator [Stratiformator vulcanicus]